MNLNFEHKINNQNQEILMLKGENKRLKDEIEKINKIIHSKYILSDNISDYSDIIKSNESEMVFSLVKSRINKPIINIQKLYQATLEGGEPFIFHSKCDGKKNTLVLIKSKGNKRFDGFSLNYWESTGDKLFKDDKNAFAFSLDKNKIICIK